MALGKFMDALLFTDRCGNPPEVQYSTYTWTGDIATYTCNSGYVHPHTWKNITEAKCQAYGQWIDVPTCECKYINKTCSKLLLILLS